MLQFDSSFMWNQFCIVLLGLHFVFPVLPWFVSLCHLWNQGLLLRYGAWQREAPAKRIELLKKATTINDTYLSHHWFWSTFVSTMTSWYQVSTLHIHFTLSDRICLVSFLMWFWLFFFVSVFEYVFWFVVYFFRLGSGANAGQADDCGFCSGRHRAELRNWE